MLSFFEDIEIRWNEVKNRRLKKTRGVTFEELLTGKVVGIIGHPAREKQSIALIEYKQYIWVVPFIVEGSGIFLKTLYPSRKYTKRHRRK